MATCLTSLPSSSFNNTSNASCAVNPLRKRSRPRIPKDLLTKDWVATAPTPASAQLTDVPTENQWLCTATPISPVDGSRATMEKVWASGSLEWYTCACSEKVSSVKMKSKLIFMNES